MGTTQKGTEMKEIEAEVKRTLSFIEDGRMQEGLDRHGPYFVIGYLMQSIKSIAEMIEQEKAATA